MSDVLEIVANKAVSGESLNRETFTLFDPVQYLETEEDFIYFLADALETNDARYIAHALGTIARARGMTKLAKETGLGRESLYKALSGEGNPSFGTILKVMHALGFQLQIKSTAQVG